MQDMLKSYHTSRLSLVSAIALNIASQKLEVENIRVSMLSKALPTWFVAYQDAELDVTENAQNMLEAMKTLPRCQLSDEQWQIVDGIEASMAAIAVLRHDRTLLKSMLHSMSFSITRVSSYAGCMVPHDIETESALLTVSHSKYHPIDYIEKLKDGSADVAFAEIFEGTSQSQSPRLYQDLVNLVSTTKMSRDVLYVFARVQGQYTYQELADSTGVTKETVVTLVERGLEKLKKLAESKYSIDDLLSFDSDFDALELLQRQAPNKRFDPAAERFHQESLW
nr:hypothetical protein [Bacilli bacterium]